MNGAGEPAARLAALREAGASRIDPVRFQFLEALARRAQGQAEPVRALLREKLTAAIADFEQRSAQAPAQGAPSAQPGVARAEAMPSPLAALHASLRHAAAARLAAAAPGEIAPEHELANARRFRQAWQAGRTLEQVEQALERKPANAGPLNSHALVLHAMALMRELSPAYLRRFLALVESLQWLEQAGEPHAQPRPGKTAPARRRRRSNDT